MEKRKLLLIATLASVTAVAVSEMVIRRFVRGDKNRLAAVVRAADGLPNRCFDGRLTGGFSYKPRGAQDRADRAESGTSSWQIAAPAANLDPADDHGRGIAFLLSGEYDNAVTSLERSVEHRPDDFAVLSDLSAAYDARGKARGHLLDFAAALETSEHAWRLRHTPEVAWNRAIALGDLHVDDAARRAWNDFLALDVDEGWRREAAQRRKDVVSPKSDWPSVEPVLLHAEGAAAESIQEAVNRFPSESLITFETTLLPDWARAARSGGTDSTTRTRLEKVAGAIAQSGEQLPAGVVAAIDRAYPKHCQEIADAHLVYAESVVAMEHHNYAQALEKLRGIEAVFGRFGSPYAAAVRLRTGICLLYENRFGLARATLASARQSLPAGRYRTLQGRIRMIEGLTLLHDARPEESIEAYSEARNAFEGTRNTRLVASAEIRLADAYGYAGDPDEAMKHRIAAFEAVHQSGDRSELFLALIEAGTSLALRRDTNAADILLSEAVREATARGRLDVAAIASMWRASLAGRRNDFAAAAVQAKQAGIYSAQTTDAGQRTLVAVTQRQLGAVPSDARDPAAAVTEVIDFFKAAGNRAWLPQLLRQRALIELANHDLSGAESDFRQAIDISEEVLSSDAPAVMRDGFAIDGRSNYEDLIELLLDRGASREALAYAERARLIGYAPPRDALSPLRQLPSDAAVVVYELRNTELVTWLAMHGDIRVYRQRLGDKAERILGALRAFPPSREALAAGYDVLIRPWIAHVPRNAQLHFAPAPPLLGLPYAALIERNSRRMVIDDYATTVSRSLSAAVQTPIRLTNADQIFLIGDPAYERLTRLSRSRQEIRDVAAEYADRASVLLDHDANAPNLLAGIKRATVFHFSGHAQVNDLSPQLSSLLLAGAGGSDTHLYIHELPARLPALKLAVLAACSTAALNVKSKSTLSLAGAFLDRGVSSVVATTRDVSDDDAAAFSISLHQALSHGETITRAVQRAQLALKQHHPGFGWMSFCLME